MGARPGRGGAPIVVSEQLTFEDVCESEQIAGDSEYTEWLAAGRPKLDTPKDSTSASSFGPR